MKCRRKNLLDRSRKRQWWLHTVTLAVVLIIPSVMLYDDIEQSSVRNYLAPHLRIDLVVSTVQEAFLRACS
jgi:hypothetical protein